MSSQRRFGRQWHDPRYHRRARVGHRRRMCWCSCCHWYRGETLICWRLCGALLTSSPLFCPQLSCPDRRTQYVGGSSPGWLWVFCQSVSSIHFSSTSICPNPCCCRPNHGFHNSMARAQQARLVFHLLGSIYLKFTDPYAMKVESNPATLC